MPTPVTLSEMRFAAVRMLSITAYHRAGGSALVVAMEMPRAMAELRRVVCSPGADGEPGMDEAELLRHITAIERSAAGGRHIDELMRP